MSPKREASSDASHPVCLVFGDDDFEVQAQCREITQAWTRDRDDIEVEVIDASASNAREVGASVAQLIQALNTQSLFSTAKRIWFRHCNFLGEGRVAQSREAGERIEELLEALKQTDYTDTALVVSAVGVDKRKRFYKWFQKEGQVIACESLASQGDRAELIASRLIADRVRESGKAVDSAVVGRIIELVGLDRRGLLGECEKAILHSGDSEQVTLADVEATVSQTRQAKAFAFADAVADRRLAPALKCLDDEIWVARQDSQKSELGLLYGLISKFRSMLLVKDLVVSGKLRVERSFASFRGQLSRLDKELFPADRRFNPALLNPYVVFRTSGQVGNYSRSELVRALELLLECNQRMISVSVDPASILREGVMEIVLPRGKASR